MTFNAYLDLYSNRIEKTDFLDSDCYNNHTMNYNELRKYIEQKIPVRELLLNLNTHKIEVHGIYPINADRVLHHLGVTNIQQISFQGNPKAKDYNYIRPNFYLGLQANEQKIFVAVTPGYDYVSQYGEVLRAFMFFNKKNPNNRVKVFHYPDVYNEISQWTDLSSTFIRPNDIVIIGYVSEIEKEMSILQNAKLLTDENNDYYGSKRYQIANKTLNFFGVKYSFWGNISAILSTKICELGALEILYIAKTGSLVSPTDLYSRLYCPDTYLNMNRDKIINKIIDIPNSLLTIKPSLNSETHVSIPTVMEEDFKQRDIAIKKGGTSLDNETSQIANSVQIFNKTNNNNVKFSCMHFATDYLYGKGEAFSSTSPNLTKGRDLIFTKKKADLLGKISKLVESYITS